MGTLYLVGTPIGNLEDVTARALRVLREVDLIAAEDTRTAGRLLRHFGIQGRLTSYWEHNELTKLDAILAALDAGDVALVSEAGMPGIADPGLTLVRAAVERGFPVVPVPGPTAFAAALAASGLPTDQFLFLGFLPRRASERRRLLGGVAEERRTLVAYESPHRLLDALQDALDALGDRRCCVARELTKRFEEIRREPISAALAHFRAEAPRGEFTLVFEGAAPSPAEPDDASILRAVQMAVERGASPRDAIEAAAAGLNVSRRRVYRLWQTAAR